MGGWFERVHPPFVRKIQNMAKVVDITGVIQIPNVQIESAIQKLSFVITGVFTLAQAQAVKIKITRQGQNTGTSSIVFESFLEDLLEMNAQMENGTFVVAANTMVGSLLLARDHALYVGQGNTLNLQITSLIATMVVEVFAVEAKAVGMGFAKWMPNNVAGQAPVQRDIALEDALFIPNDGTIERVEIAYKGRTVTYELDEMRAINRDIRGVISTNYGGAVYAGFVNWLGISMKDVVRINVIPSAANTNTIFYLVDNEAVIEYDGRLVRANDIPAVVNMAKKDFSTMAVAKISRQ